MIAAELHLSGGSFDATAAFAERGGVGIGAVLVAATIGLLHRYADQEVFAASADGREIVSDLAAAPTLLDLARQIGEASVLCVVFAEQGPCWARRRLPERLGEVGQPIGQDLVVSIATREAAIIAQLRSDRLHEAELGRMPLHLEILLRHAVEAPGTPIAHHPLLTEPERAALLDVFNRTGRALPGRSVVERFETQAAERPDAPAVIAGERTWSYRALDQQANLLARRLIGLGVGPGVLVQLCLERGAQVIVAMLAVLKAGGAYVPLDPSYPRARLAFMLEDTRGAVLLSQPELGEQIAGAKGPVLLLGSDEEDSAEEPAEARLRQPAGPRDLAYVIYTSGSSGQPKSVMLEHGGLENLVEHASFGVGPGDRVLQFSALSFDVSVWEIFATLCNGACLVLVDREAIHSEARLVRLVEAHGVTVMFLLSSLLASLSPGDFPSIRLVVTGGELFSQELVERWAPGRRMIYVYGPTEATVFQSFVECCPGAPSSPPTVGRPMPNLRYYLVDRRNVPVPVGVAGELCIAGIGVGRGYLGRPELNAEKFLVDPFTPASFADARMYRSGDRAAARENLDLEFLGRTDQQVKIRGFRIEPGEIEARLSTHPAVRQGAVVPCASPAGDKRLVAFIVPHPEGAPLAADLERHLSEALPAYMVPSTFIPLDALPRTPGGKIDRRALAERALSHRAPAISAPRDALEAEIVEIWREVLGADEIGIHDGFFDLGGHSLKAMAVASRLARRLGVEIGIQDIFLHPTIAELAPRIAKSRAMGAKTSSSIERLPDAPDYPLSSAQRGLWLFDQAQPGERHVYNVPSLYTLEGRVDEEALCAALQAVVARHESLRTTFPEVRGEPRQRVGSGADCSLEQVDLSARGDPAVVARALVGEWIFRPFDLAVGPLFRAILLRLSPARWMLALNVHHIVCDAWSLSILERDLALFYEGHGPLPLPIQIRDIGAHQRAVLARGDLDAHRAFWLEQLGRPAPPLDLPIDRPRGKNLSGQGQILAFAIEATVLAPLRGLVRETGTSLFIALCALVKVFLLRTTGARDVSIGTPIAGRGAMELEDQIGLFVNAVVLRDTLDPAWTFRKLLEQVRKTSLDAFAHQEVPFDVLVEDLEPGRVPGRHPLFDVWVVLQATRTRARALGPDLVMTAEPLDYEISLFDLSFQFEEVGDILEGKLQFDRGLYDVATIELMVARFLALSRAAARDPDVRLDAMDFASAEERALSRAANVFSGFDFSGD